MEYYIAAAERRIVQVKDIQQDLVFSSFEEAKEELDKRSYDDCDEAIFVKRDGCWHRVW